jgi:hypothetical protein
MDDAMRHRLAENEALARKVNEAIERGVWPGEEQEPVQFRCECARPDCSQPIALTLADYELVREDPRRFVVATGHQGPELETVVERRENYVVVEKRGEAGRVAEASDPRD